MENVEENYLTYESRHTPALLRSFRHRKSDIFIIGIFYNLQSLLLIHARRCIEIGFSNEFYNQSEIYLNEKKKTGKCRSNISINCADSTFILHRYVLSIIINDTPSRKRE